MTEKIDAISKKIDNNNYENNFERIKNDSETYENKIKFFQKIYIILIGLSIFFFFIFLYPYYTIHYNLNLISQIGFC